MRLKSLSFQNHPLFGDATFNFTDPKGDILNTIVLVGINGTGKTTFLNDIRSFLAYSEIRPSKNNTIYSFSLDAPDISENGIQSRYRKTLEGNIEERRNAFATLVKYRDNLLKYAKGFPDTLPKVIYLPPFYSDDKLTSTFEPYNYSYSFDNICNLRTVKNIPRFFATFIDKEIMDNDHLVVKEAVQIACDKINTLFLDLDLNIELIGLKKDGSKLPIFKNKQGHNFDINGLSSGEKQLFIRLLSLQMMSVNNSIILVDEPEVSLHPTWQQKIVKVFQSIGENNQIIFATHSPHILASVNIDSLRFFTLTDKQVQISTCKDIAVGNHAPVDVILHEFMGTSPRTPEFMTILSNIRNLVAHNKFDTPEFENFMSEAVSLAGINDIDLALIRFEINRLKASKNA